MNIVKATRQFERWLAEKIPLVRQDLALKHAHMAEASFPFFRATFYRWLQQWPELCPDLTKAPNVGGGGDPPLKNFGTWRHPETRLCWGAQWAACPSKTSVRGGTRKAAPSGGANAWMKLGRHPIRSTSCGLPPAPTS